MVRSLGFNPTQAQLRGILQEVRDPDVDTGYVQYDRFEKCMLRIVTETSLLVVEPCLSPPCVQ